MADITIESGASYYLHYEQLRGGIFWKSPLIGYMVYLDTARDLHYQKTTDGGATWGGVVEISGNVNVACDAFADWQVSGDAGTKIHIAYIDSTIDDIMYVNLETSTDTLSTPDKVADAGGDGTIYT